MKMNSEIKTAASYAAPNTIAQQIAQHIGDRIIAKELPDGYQLKVLELVEEYSASQTAVRDAFQILEKSSLVRHNPRKGTFVQSINDGDANVILEIKKRMWGLATREMMRKLNDEGIGCEEYMEMVQGILRKVDEAHPEEASVLMDASNAYILKHCGSDYLVSVINSIETQVKRFRFRSNFYSEKGRTEVKKYYSLILAGVQTNSPELIDSASMDSSIMLEARME